MKILLFHPLCAFSLSFSNILCGNKREIYHGIRSFTWKKSADVRHRRRERGPETVCLIPRREHFAGSSASAASRILSSPFASLSSCRSLHGKSATVKVPNVSKQVERIPTFYRGVRQPTPVWQMFLPRNIDPVSGFGVVRFTRDSDKQQCFHIPRSIFPRLTFLWNFRSTNFQIDFVIIMM